MGSGEESMRCTGWVGGAFGADICKVSQSQERQGSTIGMRRISNLDMKNIGRIGGHTGSTL